MQIYNTQGTFEATAETPCALRVRFNATPDTDRQTDRQTDTHTHTHTHTYIHTYTHSRAGLKQQAARSWLYRQLLKQHSGLGSPTHVYIMPGPINSTWK